MNRPAIIKAAYFAVLAIGEDPTRRNVAIMCYKICGKGLRHDEVLAVLAEIKGSANPQWGPLRDQTGITPGPQFTHENAQMGTTAGPSGDHSRAPHKVLDQQEIVQTAQEQSDASKPKKSNAKSKQKHDLSWIPELRAAANAISSKPLRDLTLEERLICGRYHAYKFANCTRSEARNCTAGAKAAVAFTKMGDSKIYGGMTLRDYADNATVYRDRMLGGAPFYDPFAIRAVLDARAAEVRR